MRPADYGQVLGRRAAFNVSVTVLLGVVCAALGVPSWLYAAVIVGFFLVQKVRDRRADRVP